MKQKVLGSYYFGQDQVDLVLMDRTGGEFYPFPENGKLPSIKIGIDYEFWWQVLEVVLHETYEFVFSRWRCRYKGTNIQTTEHTQYLFTFNHTEFSEITCRCAEFLSVALPDVKREWEKWHKKKLKGKKCQN